MQKFDGSIIELNDDFSSEKMLFTYSEEEKQENELNKMNANMVLNPGFIPLDPKLLQKWYSWVEATLFWFIEFFLKNNDRFYCTNEQMARMLNVSENTISTAINWLKYKWLIKLTYKMRWWGGKIRFLCLAKQNICDYDTQNLGVATPKKQGNIYNKIIENKNIDINSNNITTKSEDFEEKQENSSLKINQQLAEKESSAKEKEYWNQNVNDLINNIKSLCDSLGIVYDKTNDRNFARHILTAKEYWEVCDKVWMSRVDFALSVLKASVAINYFKGACSWPQKIYQNYSDVYNRTKAKSQKNYIPQNDAL